MKVEEPLVSSTIVECQGVELGAEPVHVLIRCGGYDLIAVVDDVRENLAACVECEHDVLVSKLVGDAIHNVAEGVLELITEVGEVIGAERVRSVSTRFPVDDDGSAVASPFDP